MMTEMTKKMIITFSIYRRSSTRKTSGRNIFTSPPLVVVVVIITITIIIIGVTIFFLVCRPNLMWSGGSGDDTGVEILRDHRMMVMMVMMVMVEVCSTALSTTGRHVIITRPSD